MSRSQNVLAFVMAGGEGSRLHTLAAERIEWLKGEARTGAQP